MKRYTFIVNPEAGRGHGRKLLEPLRRELQARKVEHQILVTRRSGEAVELARNCFGATVVSVGGDGTLNEIVNGFREDGEALGIIPAGSGNDFIKAVNNPKRLNDALDVVLAGRIRRVDVGVISCSAANPGPGTVETSDRSFLNGVGVGFDGAVAARMRTIKHLGGTAVYVVAVLQTLGRFKSPWFRTTIDGVEANSRNLLIAIGNGCCAAGSFYLTPEAVVDDGLLDLCLIQDVSVGKILRLMPFVMLGRHGWIREVSFQKSREKILIESNESFAVHADGEVVGQGVNGVSITLRPRSLPLLTV